MTDHLRLALGRVHRNPKYQFGLLFMDLDRFKIINDSLGHLAGDQLLITVAERLKGVIREGDAVARLGGDEFTVFVNDFSREATNIMKVAERIQEVLTQPVQLGTHTVHVGASIGIAMSVTGYTTPEDMIRDADTAMYRAKKAGTGQIQMFDAGMHNTAVTRLEMETDLRRAIAEGQFFLMYQPIMRYEDGALAGFEALLRWRHPERGLIPPMEFIPLAEETRLMVTIGRWVLEEACSFLGNWRREDPAAEDLVISVNVSAVQLREPGFTALVKTTLERTSVPGSRLKLELTESMLIKNTEQIAEVLDELRALGIEVMIDDFGTGFSSLSYLAHLPMDALKIDRGFISGRQKVAESIEIVRCIVAMAKALGIHTVAEGVESEEQDDWLRDMSCDFAQGFYHHKPMEAEEARALLQAGEAETKLL